MKNTLMLSKEELSKYTITEDELEILEMLGTDDEEQALLQIIDEDRLLLLKTIYNNQLIDRMAYCDDGVGLGRKLTMMYVESILKNKKDFVIYLYNLPEVCLVDMASWELIEILEGKGYEEMIDIVKQLEGFDPEDEWQ